ncbi:lysine 2,3-aminomutase [Anaerospora hongkongensis]|jgi:lysine 2,3-aminomutase|uniref:L-lysine 2,3-aminomutase n=1 Tax=Anaerospora hongkongensis TaxID=244830 RepID=A0A4V2Q7E5_9FIRM|nr:lysine 2,3-aminomutase [Anaerospora hongkongensis]TCL31589.1 lysine 2,3-aminomutase [Anaerospora hongkongensis]
MRNYRDIPLWAHVKEEDWQDWRWQVANRITSPEQLKQVIPLTAEEEEGIKNCLQSLRMAITPYYATLIDPENVCCPVRKQAVPTAAELDYSHFDMADPLHEDQDSPVFGLTHRYPDRVLLLVTDQCSMYCRHCTRRRIAGACDQARTKQQIDACIRYIRDTPVVRDVVLSGGDAFLLSDDLIEYILKELRQIEHVEIIRFGTRTPVVLPQRVTKELCDMLKRYHPIYVNVHFNHPKEITPASREACARLADAGIPLGNQAVLLKGVNDCPELIKKLMQELLAIRVRPYYIYQCDMSKGIQHFRTPISSGIQAIEYMRGHTSGLAVPTYVVDAPGGGGKIPVMPQYLVSQNSGKYILRNYEGVFTTYTEPRHVVDPEMPCEVCGGYHRDIKIGLTALLSGETCSLERPVQLRNESGQDVNKKDLTMAL